MKKVWILVSVVCVLFLVSCGTDRGTGVDLSTVEPEWVRSPPIIEGKTVGVGSCPYHVDGDDAQKNEAIRHAINQIAMQRRTTVDASSAITSDGTRDGNTTNIRSASVQTVSGEIVTADINATWKNPKTHVLWVLMVSR